MIDCWSEIFLNQFVMSLNMSINTFFDLLPVFVWNGVFSFVTALVVGLIIAFVTTFYLKKRDEMTRVSGVILEKRVNAEQKILDFLAGVSFHREMPRKDSEHYYEFLKAWEFRLPHGRNLQYSDVFGSAKKFRDFFKGFEEIISTNTLWMGERVRLHLTLMQMYFSCINTLLVALQRVPLPDGQHLSSDEFEQLSDTLVLLVAVTLDDEIGGLLAHLEVLMVDSVYRLDIRRPKKSLMRNGLLNRDTSKIFRELSDNTFLGAEREQFFLLVVLLVFQKKNIPLKREVVERATKGLGE